MTWNSSDSLEVIEISDSDSDLESESESDSDLERGESPFPFPTQTSHASSELEQGRTVSSPDESSDVLVIDSTDSEDLDELEAKLKQVYFGKKTWAVASDSRFGPSNSTSIGRTRTRIGPQEPQDEVLVISSSEEDSVDVQPVIQSRPSSSNNTTKEITRPSVGRRRRKKSVISSSPKVLKAQAKEQTKEQAKLQRDLNKLVTDKKSTLKDFTVELSRTFEGHPFVDYLEPKLGAHGCSVSFFDPPPQCEHLIRFRRQHIAQYDNRSKEWVPITPYAALEDLYVLFLSADALTLAIADETFTETLSTLRSTHRLTTRSQVFIMVDGLNAYYKRKGGSKDKRSRMELALTSLQALERCFIVQVEGAEDTAQWLFNIAGDLGIRPHKRIRESFLPFCTDTQIKCGSSKADTYKKMLQQIRNITESAADGIIEKAPTLRALFQGYAQEADIHNRHDRLKEVTVSNRRDGAAKSRILNHALSKKVHDVIWGEDPLTLV